MGGISIPPVSGIKNKIINGCMRVPQRGTSFTVNQANSVYTLDRWYQGNTHDAGNITVTQDAAVPNNNFQHSLKVTNAAGNDTSLTSVQLSYLLHVVEGYNIVPLRSGKFTLSFWVRSSKTGIYCVSFLDSTSTRSYVVEYMINAANTWEYKTISVDLSVGIGAGTWNYTNGRGIQVYFGLAYGSYYQTANKDTWQTIGAWGTANQVNWLNEQNNTFYITGVQLEKGDAPTEFESRDFGTELRMCQRYYWQTYQQGAVPGTATFTNALNSERAVFTDDQYNVSFPQTMRATPVVTTYSANSGASGMWYASGDGLDKATSQYQLGDSRINIGAATGGVNGMGYFHLVADAEI